MKDGRVLALSERGHALTEENLGQAYGVPQVAHQVSSANLIS